MPKKRYHHPTFRRLTRRQLERCLRLCVTVMDRMHVGGWVGPFGSAGIVSGNDRARGHAGCGFPL
jgi:hypothetical protein